MNQHTAHVARVAPIHTGSCPIKVAMSTKTFAGARVGTLEKIAANEHKHKDSPDHSSPLSLLGSICSAFPKDEITKIFPSYLKCTLFVAECSAKQSSTESCQLVLFGPNLKRGALPGGLCTQTLRILSGFIRLY